MKIGAAIIENSVAQLTGFLKLNVHKRFLIGLVPLVSTFKSTEPYQIDFPKPSFHFVFMLLKSLQRTHIALE